MNTTIEQITYLTTWLLVCRGAKHREYDGGTIFVDTSEVSDIDHKTLGRLKGRLSRLNDYRLISRPSANNFILRPRT